MAMVSSNRPAPRIGLGLLSCQRSPLDARSWAEIYRDALELCRIADREGFGSIWCPEHHFFSDGYISGVMPWAAAVAAVTRHVLIGTDILQAPLHHPIRLAEDAATVDLISNGRLVLGLGTGWRTEEFDVFGSDHARRGRVLSETARVLRGAFGPGPFTFEGQVYRFTNLDVTPKPARAGGVPIWLGGYADPAIRRAARVGDGYIAPFTGFEEAQRRRELIERTAAAEGRDLTGYQFAFHHYMHVTDDVDAFTEAAPHLLYARRQLAHIAGGPAPAATDWADLRDPAEVAALRGSVVAGPPELLRDWIGRFHAAVGDDVLFIARLYLPGLGFERQARSLRLFAREVAGFDRPEPAP